jgi:hypothetical protein
MPANLFTFLERGLAQTRKYGLGLVRHRYVTRPRILKSAPVLCPEDSPLEVHTMVCQRDWLNGIWALKSFRAAAEQRFRLVIFHDGSLSPLDLKQIHYHFPGVVIPSQDFITSRVEQRLTPLAPTVVKLRNSGKCFILRKTVDSWACAQQRWVLKIDPDVLFFRRPDELLNPEATLAGRYAAFNAHRPRSHRDGVYCLDPEALKSQFGMDLPAEFNDGLGAVDTSLADWAFVEQVFQALPLREDLLFMTAQTVEAIFCLRRGYLQLPAERYNVEPEDVAVDDVTVARHYLSKTRDRLYVEGIPRLLTMASARKFVT